MVTAQLQLQLAATVLAFNAPVTASVPQRLCLIAIRKVVCVCSVALTPTARRLRPPARTARALSSQLMNLLRLPMRRWSSPRYVGFTWLAN